MMVGSGGWGDGLGRPPQAAYRQPKEKGWRIAPPHRQSPKGLRPLWRAGRDSCLCGGRHFSLSARADGREKCKVWFRLMTKPTRAAGEPVGHEFSLPTAKSGAAFCQREGWRIAPPLRERAGLAVRPRGPSARAGMGYWGRMAVDCSMKSATQSSADISP